MSWTKPPRFRSVVLGCAAALAISAAPASAAAPANDTSATATQLTTLPFDQKKIDIAAAGTEAVDSQLYSECGGDALEHTVWYRYTNTSNLAGVLQVSATTNGSWQPGVAAMVGAPTLDGLRSCGNDDTYIQLAPGETYYFAAYSRTAGATGTMNVHAALIPQTLFLTLDSVAAGPKGSVAVAGTYTCAGRNPYGYLQVRVAPFTRQENSVFIEALTCNGKAQPWQATVSPYTGKFYGSKGAQVRVDVYGFVCESVCQEAEQTTTATIAP
jgi:hypothetical protein